MENFAAIDFETANGNRSSVCSIGVVVVKGGMIAKRFYKLIHPVPNYYSPANIVVHGIRKEDTEAEDTFPEVWAEIAPEIEGLPLVAHFSQFDESCLKAAFHCTCKASRKVFGKRLPNHKLDTVAAHCGFDLKSHHHALADAEACAAIAMKIL